MTKYLWLTPSIIVRADAITALTATVMMEGTQEVHVVVAGTSLFVGVFPDLKSAREQMMHIIQGIPEHLLMPLHGAQAAND